MRLTLEGLNESFEYINNGIEIPKLDIDKLRLETAKNPKWVHFGAGNIFRGFMAGALQEIIEYGYENTGVIAVETFDEEIIEKIYKPFDNLTLNITASKTGELSKTVIASITEALVGNPSYESDWERLVEIFTNPSLQMASFTVTEKGYVLKNNMGKWLPAVEEDIKNGPSSPNHVISCITALLYNRYEAEELPVALVSMDNCSKNGDKLKGAVLEMATQWLSNKFVSQGFLDYLNNPKKITYPWTMIDRITPRPSETVAKSLKTIGFEDMEGIITKKGTYIAPFVNSEENRYLFIEDDFPNGRMNLDKAKGIWLTDRETVNRVETMKVTTCLNPLHTSIAIVGWLLGYEKVVDAIKDELVCKLVKRIGYIEGLPVVTDPGIIRPIDFLNEVINERFVNPFVPDTTMRIATDTSQKVGIRFGETIKAYMQKGTCEIQKLVGINLVIAAWLRYLHGTDDEGRPITLSSDPLLEELQEHIKRNEIELILRNKQIFAVDLVEAGLAPRIVEMYEEMKRGNGAVRNTVAKYLSISEES